MEEITLCFMDNVSNSFRKNGYQFGCSKPEGKSTHADKYLVLCKRSFSNPFKMANKHKIGYQILKQ